MVHDLLAEAERLDLVEWRCDFHRHPELGFEERLTADKVARHLEGLGWDVQTGVAY